MADHPPPSPGAAATEKLWGVFENPTGWASDALTIREAFEGGADLQEAWTSFLSGRCLSFEDAPGPTANALTAVVEFGPANAPQILANTKDSRPARRSVGGTALHKAAAKQSPELVRFFVRQGAGVDLVDASGRTPLHLCCRRHGYRSPVSGEVVIFLVDSGADVNRLEGLEGDETPWESPLQLLMRGGGYFWGDPDHPPVGSCFRAAKALIDKGADINLPTGAPSPLALAITQRHFSDVKELLIRRGAKIRGRDEVLEALRSSDMMGRRGDRHRGMEDLDLALHVITVVDEYKLDIADTDFLGYRRDGSLKELTLLLSHGANGVLQEGRNLADIANDEQNVHTSLQTAMLRKHLEEARRSLKAANIPTQPTDPERQLQYLLEQLQNFPESSFQTLCADAPHCAGRSPFQIRESLSGQLRRFYRELNSENPARSFGALVSGPEVVHIVLERLALLPSVSRQDALEIVFGALLNAGNEYGWGMASCPQGSVSFVLSVLQGRVDVLSGTTSAGANDAPHPADLPSYLALLQKVRAAGEEPGSLQAEALARVSTSQQMSERVRKALTIMQDDSDAFQWAVNDIRGSFFAVLLEEHETLVNKLLVPADVDDMMVDDEDQRNFLPGMLDLLACLRQFSMVLTDAVTKPASVIADVLIPAVGGEVGSSSQF